MKEYILITLLVFSSTTALAVKGEGRDPVKANESKFQKPEIVKWIGTVKGDSSQHTTEHNHELRFIKQSDQEEFDIVESPKLVTLHHKNEKNYLMEIEAEKTPRFLFWGGNLIVKKFKVLKELESVPHQIPSKKISSNAFSEHR